MSAKARVYNDHSKDYHEKNDEWDITVPARGFIEMDYYDAVKFVSRYTPIKRTGNDEDREPKMLRIVQIAVDAQQKSICMLCQDEFKDDADLAKHSEKEHSDRIVRDKKR